MPPCEALWHGDIHPRDCSCSRQSALCWWHVHVSVLAGRLPGTVVSVALLCLSPADFGRAQESTRDPHECSSGASGKVKGDKLLPLSPGSLAIFAEAVTDKKLSHHHPSPVRRRGDAPSMKNRRHRGCISHCLHTQLSVAQWLA